MVAVEKNNISEKSNLLGCKTLHPKEGYKQTELGLIPVDWEVKKLIEIADFNPESLSEKTLPNYEFEYIDISSIENTGIISKKLKITFSDAPSRARRIVKKDDIILSTVRPYLKAFALIKEDKKNLICSTGYAVLRTSTNISNIFVYQSTLSELFMNQVNVSLVGSNYPAINNDDLKKIKMPIPSLQEQKKIASILSTWDNAIEKTEKLIETKTKLKKALMQQLLTGKKRFKDFIKSNEYKQTELGFIPFDWSFLTLPNISTNGPQNGLYKHKSFYGKGFKIAELNDLYKYNNKLYVDNLKNYISLNEKEKEIYSLLEDDILINRVSKQISGIAKSLLVKNVNSKVIFESNMMRVTLNKKIIYPLFFIYFSKSKLYLEQIIGLAKVSNQTSISQEGLNKLNIPIPQLKEQIKIASVLNSCDKEIELLEKKLETLKNQKKGLMQKLLTGQIRVKTDI